MNLKAIWEMSDKPRPMTKNIELEVIFRRTGSWLNNRAEDSHQPFRRRERAMAKFRSAKSLQKFASIHASVHNHLNQERHLYNRENLKLNRSAALAE
jgi:putative transposase